MERYKQECKKISEQINPSDEFVQNLKSNLNKKVTQEKMKRKYLLSKVAMIFFTITLVSSGVFAKDIGNWLSQIFSNTDESMQIAVENGYVQNVDMEYVENEGIAIKVNSLVIDDNKMNIVFDVKGEVNGKLGIKKLELSGNNNLDNFNVKELNLASTRYEKEFKSLDKKNHILILKISNIEQKLDDLQTLNICFNNFIIMKQDNVNEIIEGTWECNVVVDEDNFKNKSGLAYKYVIEENDYIENYEINVTNTGTNIKLCFIEEFDKAILLNRNNIYIEKKDGQKIQCRNFSGIASNMVNLEIPITKTDEIDEFKIILNINNEKIIFNVKKENG